MTCDSVRDRLDAYVLDEMRFSERVLIGVHVGRCRACADELADYKFIAQLAPGAVAHPIPRDSYVRLRIRVNRHNKQFPDPTSFQLRRMYAFANRVIAAAIVLVLSGLTAPFAKHIKIPAVQIDEELGNDCAPLKPTLKYCKSVDARFPPELTANDDSIPSDAGYREHV